jgi:hypothetical protein
VQPPKKYKADHPLLADAEATQRPREVEAQFGVLVVLVVVAERVTEP